MQLGFGKISKITIAYVVLAIVAMVIALADPSNDPISGIFVIPLAMPWILLADNLVSDSHLLDLDLVTGSLLLNAAILHLLSKTWLG